MDYAAHVAKKHTPQTEPLLGEAQVKNNAGGFVYALDEWKCLDRFLILGTEGGTYYVGERELTRKNAEQVMLLIKKDGARVVKRTVEISDSGRAPKNSPAIFVLALCASIGDAETKALAFKHLGDVCRIGTHLFEFAQAINQMRGWGRGLRAAIGNWYLNKAPMDLAYQLFKYKQRDGWAHRDLLRLSHVKASNATQDALLGHAVGKPKAVEGEVGVWLDAVQALVTATPVNAAKLISKHRLPREVVPTELLNTPEIWEALLEHMPPHALIRNLANLTRAGVLKPLSAGNAVVLRKLSEHDALCKARVHPIACLNAMKVYAQGHGERGGNTWEPVPQVVDALEAAFYGTFKGVTPSGKGVLLALDVSGSMTCGAIAGLHGLTPNIASAAMAMVTARVEPNYHIMAFDNGLQDLRLTAKHDLAHVIKKTAGINGGGTDCALPMLWATKEKIKVDQFVVYTDSETWAGQVHPVQALREYRKKMGINAKLVVVGMTATEFTIADPTDAGMLDVVGFDAAAPAVISDFARS